MVIVVFSSCALVHLSSLALRIESAGRKTPHSKLNPKSGIFSPPSFFGIDQTKTMLKAETAPLVEMEERS
jgi:hypothetical protein